MSNVKYSIIIASYNAAHVLADSIKSVLAQDIDRSLYELLIIDGASTDETKYILSTFSCNIDFISSEVDSGLYDAWNKGIAAANGSWILFLGADDTLLPTALSSFDEFLSLNPGLDYVSGQVVLRYAAGKSRVIGQPWIWSEFRRFMTTAHVGSLHSIHLFHAYGSFSLRYRVCSDYHFFLRIGPCLKAGFMPKLVATMAAGGMSQSSITPILESRKIKISTKAASRFEANLDFTHALLKWLLSRLLLF